MQCIQVCMDPCGDKADKPLVTIGLKLLSESGIFIACTCGLLSSGGSSVVIL